MNNDNIRASQDDRSIDRQVQELAGLVQRMDATLKKVQEELTGMKQRMLTYERRTRVLASPTQSIPLQRDSDHQIGAYDFEFLTPAVQQTYDIVVELTENPGHWVSLDDVVAQSPRSRSTESAYLKTLFRKGYVRRKAKLAGTAEGRRVRKFVYRPTE